MSSNEKPSLVKSVQNFNVVCQKIKRLQEEWEDTKERLKEPTEQQIAEMTKKERYELRLKRHEKKCQKINGNFKVVTIPSCSNLYDVMVREKYGEIEAKFEERHIEKKQEDIGEIDEIEKININRASELQLCMLNCIGPSKARAIIAYRSVKKFETIEEIQKIKGIGESTWKKIQYQIKV